MAYDNTCKYLAEKYSTEFARWLFPSDTSDVTVLKTELSSEPIRADSVTFLQMSNYILHLEFQTEPTSTPPLDFRMLDYYTRLKRKYWCKIEQVVIFLQQTGSDKVFQTEYTDDNTRHRYRVIQMWEENPDPLLANPALLPLASLAKSDTPNALLEQVAAAVDMIEESTMRNDISAGTQVLAGLRFEKDVIRQLFREEAMQESVIYQDILQRGEQRGEQRGIQKGEVTVILRLLNRRFRAAIAPEIEQRIRGLSIAQLENLTEALLDFANMGDLNNWLETHST